MFINNLLGVAFNVFIGESYEFVIPKGVIHLGEKFVREAQPQGFAVLGGHQKLVTSQREV